MRDLAGNREASQPVPGLKEPRAWVKVLLAGRVRHRRPLWLALRLITAATAAALTVASVGWQPASLAVGTGAVT